jgi:hypothetical protein
MENEYKPHAGCVGEQSQEQHGAGCAGAIGQLASSNARDGDAGGTGCAPSEPAMTTSETPNPPHTLREFERALRFLGYSRLQAEHISRKGFAGFHAEQQPPEPEPAPAPEPAAAAPDQLRQALQRLALTLKA